MLSQNEIKLLPHETMEYFPTNFLIKNYLLFYFIVDANDVDGVGTGTM